MRLTSFGPWLRRSRCEVCGRALGHHEWVEMDKIGISVACSLSDKASADSLLKEVESLWSLPLGSDPGEST